MARKRTDKQKRLSILLKRDKGENRPSRHRFLTHEEIAKIQGL